MAATASIGILDNDNDYEPQAEVLQLDSGARFITVRLDDGYASFIPPGTDLRAVAYVRKLAAALHAAADQLEAQHKQHPAPDPIPVPVEA